MTGQTGVEMEALTAVSVACLTLYDMLKAADKAMVIGGIRLMEKTGGRSGTYRAATRANVECLESKRTHTVSCGARPGPKLPRMTSG